MIRAKNNIDLSLKSVENEDIYIKEVFKALTKIDLRYKSSQINLLNQLVDEIAIKNYSSFNLSKFKWVSPFLPMIHYSKDFYRREFFTYRFF